MGDSMRHDPDRGVRWGRRGAIPRRPWITRPAEAGRCGFRPARARAAPGHRPDRRSLKCVLQRLVAAEALDVPGVELAQIAVGALGAKMLAGAIDHPIELGEDLVSGRVTTQVPSSSPNSHGFPSEPRASWIAAAPVCANASTGLLGGAQAAGDQHRNGQLLDQPPGELIVGTAAVALRRVSRMDAESRHATVIGQPPGGLDPLVIPGTQPGTQLDGDGQATAAGRRERQRNRQIGVIEQGRAGAGLADLRDRAAHVDVDQVRARRRDSLRGGRHHIGIVAEQLDRHRVLIGVDPQQLGAGALVAVVHGKARDHLGHGQAGAVALGLQPHEPVADPGQWRKHDPVGDLHPTQAPRVGQRRGHRP